jgi:hypothetical protein
MRARLAPREPDRLACLDNNKPVGGFHGFLRQERRLRHRRIMGEGPATATEVDMTK